MTMPIPSIHWRAVLRGRVLLVAAGCGLAAVMIIVAVRESVPTPQCHYALEDADGEAPKAQMAVARLVDAYEGQRIGRDAFREAIAAIEDPGLPQELACDFAGTTVLRRRAEPYRIAEDLTVLADATLVIEEGVEIIIGRDVSLTVSGRLYVLGSREAAVWIHGEAPKRFNKIHLQGGPNEIVWAELENARQLLSITHPPSTRTLIENSRFDGWSQLAIHQLDSGGLRISRSSFGLRTGDADRSAETINARQSGHMVIEDSLFGSRRDNNDVIDLNNCAANSWSIISGNSFEGGEDDAIDLDECSAFVVGNRIRNFKPEDPYGLLSLPFARWVFARLFKGNGGGITGSGILSKSVILNNVIEDSYHAIGFKDGAQPVILNNTIINNNIGVTLYQSKTGKPKPSGVLINNVLWNNVDWRSKAVPQDIVLNGKWWPHYSQANDVQASLDARYNIAASFPVSIEGDNNITDDPHLEFVDGIPVPRAGSPAIDSGLGDLYLPDVPMAELIRYLSSDFRDMPRRTEGARILGIDRGAVEVPWSAGQTTREALDAPPD